MGNGSPSIGWVMIESSFGTDSPPRLESWDLILFLSKLSSLLVVWVRTSFFLSVSASSELASSISRSWLSFEISVEGDGLEASYSRGFSGSVGKSLLRGFFLLLTCHFHYICVSEHGRIYRQRWQYDFWTRSWMAVEAGQSPQQEGSDDGAALKICVPDFRSRSAISANIGRKKLTKAAPGKAVPGRIVTTMGSTQWHEEGSWFLMQMRTLTKPSHRRRDGL